MGHRVVSNVEACFQVVVSMYGYCVSLGHRCLGFGIRFGKTVLGLYDTTMSIPFRFGGDLPIRMDKSYCDGMFDRLGVFPAAQVGVLKNMVATAVDADMQLMPVLGNY